MKDIISPNMNKLSIESYAVELSPNFDTFTFTGISVMTGSADGVVDVLELHAVEIEVTGARVSGVDARSIESGDSIVKIVPAQPVSGNVEIRLEFTGSLNDKLVGFYRSRMGEGYCGVTQFEERDARRAFPCIDHPSRKSVFHISLIAPEGMTAISNTGVASVDELDGGAKRFRFHPTPPMPTYLLFFGVGAYDIVTDDSFRIPVRVAAAAGRAESGLKAAFYAGKSVDYLDEYTGVDYPLDKLDLIGVEDFAYGAMENFGAVTYRESYLYLDPDASSQSDLEGVAGVTAHEIAHMWFGDLVSPADWGYVWLNEAFATYFGNVIVDDLHPEWRVLEGFVAGTHGSTMERDSLADTVPIEFEEGTFDEIDPSNVPIIYGKAGATLHMVRDFIGDGEFRKGVHAFLSDWQYRSATTDNFLESFGAGAGEENARLLERWIRRPGFPVVSAVREGSRITCSQRRFVLGDPIDDEPWPIPLTVLAMAADGSTRRISSVFDTAQTTVDIPEGTVAFKINAAQAGLYRVAYDDASLAALVEHYAKFDVTDRAGILGDLSALHYEGSVSTATIYAFARAAADETEERPLRAICGALNRCYSRLPAERETSTELLGRILVPLVERLGTMPLENDTPVESRLRPDILWWLFRIGHAQAVRSLEELAAKVAADEKVPVDLYPMLLRVAAVSRIVDPEWFESRIEDLTITEVKRRHLLSGCGWFQERNDIDRILDFAAERVPQHNKHIPVTASAGNPEAGEALLPWLERSISKLSELQRFALSRIVALAVPAGGVGKIDAMKNFVDTRLSSLNIEGTVRMSLERMYALDRFVKRNTSR